MSSSRGWSSQGDKSLLFGVILLVEEVEAYALGLNILVSTAVDDPWQQYSSSGTILEMAIRVWCRGRKESPVFCSTPFSKALCDGAIPSACAGMTIG